MSTNEFFENLWNDYIKITPQAESVRQLFVSRGEVVQNDHVAFRTFSNSPISLENLSKVLENMGYMAYENYRFEQKKLDAKSFIHRSDKDAPKIFLSEIIVEQLSAKAQSIIKKLTSQITADAVKDPSIFWQGRLWEIPSRTDYETLLQESEYAAWLATIGLRVNHFTVSVNKLKGFSDLQEVNNLIKDSGYPMNTVGGEIKGSAAVYLEQSSTMADKIQVTFKDGDSGTIPSCFYEFAKRYDTPDEELFQGFIEGNADKIFESTYSR